MLVEPAVKTEGSGSKRLVKPGAPLRPAQEIRFAARRRHTGRDGLSVRGGAD